MGNGVVSHFFIRRGARVTGPFNAAKVSDMERRGVLDDETEWSPNKIQWYPLSELPWRQKAPSETNPRLTPSMVAKSSAESSSDKQHLFSGHNPPASALETSTPLRVKTMPPTLIASAQPAFGANTLGGGYQGILQNGAGAAAQPVPTPNGGWDGLAQPLPGVVQSNPDPVVAPGEAFGQFFGDVAAVLWRPADGLQRIHRVYGDNGALQAGVSLMVLSSAILFFIINKAIPSLPGGGTSQGAPSFWNILFLLAVPFISLFFCCLLTRQFFGTSGKGGVGGDFLLSGSFAWYATATIAMIIAALKLFERHMQNMEQLRWIAAAFIVIVLYGACSIVVSMFVGLTEISGIKRPSACLLISIIGSGTIMISAFLFSQIYSFLPGAF